MYCEQCGAEMEQGARFCSACGTGVTSDGHTSVPSSAMRRKALAATVLGGIVVFGGVLLWTSLPERSVLGQDAPRKGGVADSSKELTRDLAGAARESDLDKEAVNAAQAKLEERAAQCGDSYFGYVLAIGRNDLHQYKNVRYYLEPYPLSSADKLNGIQWSGRIVYVPEVYRRYGRGRWEEWSNGYYMGRSSHYNDPLAFSLQRINGQWRIGTTLGMRMAKCSDVP